GAPPRPGNRACGRSSTRPGVLARLLRGAVGHGERAMLVAGVFLVRVVERLEERFLLVRVVLVDLVLRQVLDGAIGHGPPPASMILLDRLPARAFPRRRRPPGQWITRLARAFDSRAVAMRRCGSSARRSDRRASMARSWSSWKSEGRSRLTSAPSSAAIG